MDQLADKVDMLSRTVIKEDEPPLNVEETKEATEKLVKPLYKAVTRVKCDPIISGQTYGLFSFTPASGAQPNQYGIYGIAKMRGNFKTTTEAEEYAQYLVRNVDSNNEILHVRVGQEFPLTKETKFTENFDKVDLSKDVRDISTQEERKNKEKDAQEIKSLKEREQRLLRENKEIQDGTFKEDPLGVYIMKHVKRSQLKWTLAETMRKLNEEVKPALQKAIKEIREMDEEYPDFKDKYFEQYMAARREAGLTDDNLSREKGQLGFMKYLVEDVSLDEIDEEKKE
jgi:hypothetical protein